MEVRKTSLQDGDGLGGQACVAVDLAPLADKTLTDPGGEVADNPRQKNLYEVTRREGSLPG
jgi:hypothetical protein